MPKCIECGKDYTTKPGGDIMLSWCYECREENRKDPQPDNYIKRAGVLVPNPEHAAWTQRRQKRLQQL